MKIGLMELDHYEMGYSILKTLNYNDHNILVFTTEKLRDRFQAALNSSPNINYIVKENSEPMLTFYKRVVDHSRKGEVTALWVNTIEYNFEEFAEMISSLKCKKILTVHNANFWFDHNKLFFTKSYRANKYKINLLKQMDAFVALSNNVKNYITEKFHLRKKTFVFPYSIFEEDQLVSTEGTNSKLVVPGSIDFLRRDYHFILKVYQKLYAEISHLELVLLGTPKGEYGAEIIKLSQDINSSGGKITWYKDEVDQKEFDRQILSCSLIVSPLQRQIGREQYGKSKETGCFFDMVRYAKPGIVPDYVPVPFNMDNSVISYKSEDDLLDLVKSILRDPARRNELNYLAKRNSQRFSVGNLRNEPEGIINYILS